MLANTNSLSDSFYVEAFRFFKYGLVLFQQKHRQRHLVTLVTQKLISKWRAVSNFWRNNVDPQFMSECHVLALELAQLQVCTLKHLI